MNRTGDELSATGGVNPPVGSVGVANESALKLALQYTFERTGTTAGVLWEKNCFTGTTLKAVSTGLIYAF